MSKVVGLLLPLVVACGHEGGGGGGDIFLNRLLASESSGPDATHLYLDRLLAGDRAAIAGDFSGEPTIDDPVGGAVCGSDALDRFVAERYAWLAARAAHLSPVRIIRAGGRTVFEGLLHLVQDGRHIELPIAVVGEV